MSTFTVTLQSFFTTFLVGQKAASHHTISAYRDAFRMLLRHLHDTTGTTPDRVEFADVNAEAITAFLTYLEAIRKNTIRTRNARLAALHAFFAYAAYLHPEHADMIARVSRTTPNLGHRTSRRWLGNYEKLACSGCPSLRMKTTLDKSYSPCSEGYSRVTTRYRNQNSPVDPG